MIYAISDIHGEYEKYREMLKKIRFSDSDTLYVLGDVVDRGPEPVKLLEDMSARENVILLKGNHEIMALDILRRLNVEITEGNVETQLDSETIQDLLYWQKDGGRTTLLAFKQLSREKRADLLDYMEDTAAYEIAEVNGRTFFLVHAGLGNYDPERSFDDYTLKDFTFVRPDYQKRYFSNPSMYIVSGHTPTFMVTGKTEIYRCSNNILIDCGAAYGGKLACLCLDDMREYYV